MSEALLKKTNIYSFDANHIEAMLANNDWAGCWEYLGQVIETLTLTASTEAQLLGIKLQRDMADEQKKKYVNDFGALLGELFLYLLTDPSTTLSDASFENLIYYHETLHTLFYIYNIDNTDEAALSIIGDGKKDLSATQQKKLLLLLSMDTKLDIVKILKNIDPKYRVPTLVSYFSHRKIFREDIYHNKIKLYELRRDVERASNFIKALLNSITVYFLSSYLNYSDKHLIKENINVATRNYLSSTAKDQKRIKNEPRDKGRFEINPDLPTIVVFAELFSKHHAMYRCYGDRVMALQAKFNVILVTPVDKGDPRLAEDFKNYVTFGQIGELYKIIHDAAPDIIFMPSVGMRFYSVLLSVTRLAPIQVMSLGHPATTMSPEIDFILGPPNLYDERAFPRDRYINDGPPQAFLPMLSKEEFFAPVKIESGPKKIIKVAVVGSDIKVSFPFFKLLKEIVAESPFEIHVSFMMAIGGIDSLYIEKFLKDNFKNSTYYGWQSFEEYLTTIKTIDVVLNPFPFGHTNTIIDTLMCGKPCIGMEGPEPASKTETYVLDIVGMKEEFVARDEEDYKRKFFGIAERIMKGETYFYDRENAYNELFKHTTEENDYSHVMQWLYDNSDKLKASKRKYFDVFEEI